MGDSVLASVVDIEALPPGFLTNRTGAEANELLALKFLWSQSLPYDKEFFVGHPIYYEGAPR